MLCRLWKWRPVSFFFFNFFYFWDRGLGRWMALSSLLFSLLSVPSLFGKKYMRLLFNPHYYLLPCLSALVLKGALSLHLLIHPNSSWKHTVLEHSLVQALWTSGAEKWTLCVYPSSAFYLLRETKRHTEEGIALLTREFQTYIRVLSNRNRVSWETMRQEVELGCRVYRTRSVADVKESVHG